MLTKYELKMPHAVYSGEDALGRISEIFAANEVKRLVVFTDKGIEGAGLLEFPMAKVRETGVETVILDDLPAEPSYMEAQKLVDQCKDCGADFIMAVGGGSVMDTAKLASVLMTDEYGIKELLDEPGRARKCMKTLMIPTTAGTGSEATPNAIVAVPEKQLKVGIVNTEMIADYVILDAVMIKKLPRKIAAATGVDALAHAIECYTSNKANPFSDLFALQALDMILNSIERACDDPEAMDAKNTMLLASFYAGVAITASGTTAVHALSYPLGGKYHIAHGVSNAILLAPVMRFNEPACRPLLAKAYDRCLKGDAKTEEEKSAAVIQRLEGIVKHLDIPTSLTEFGVPKEDLEALVASGMEVTRLLVNNMRPVTTEDARNIYQEVL
nr:iron-containing alcohol dehydrogenase [uncultured Oscillibacter sp.]